MKNAAAWVQTYDQCKNIKVDSITVDSRAFWNNDGIDIVDCDSVAITNSYIDSDDDGICLKSHDPNSVCQNVLVKNCTIRSSANGIKFGTASLGGFKNIKLISNKSKYSQFIKSEAKRLGFLSCGISKAGFLEEDAPRLEAYLKQDFHGQMSYMENHFDKRLKKA